MANKMLIDASHPEETRVVVLRGNRVEEFDFESASKKQLRGNIYLAKVTRVEPSLQAAFIEYGGNRHGFLAFSEIHPDYYQIPVADRLALLEEEARQHRDEEEEESRPRRTNNNRRSRRTGGRDRGSERRTPADGSVSELAPAHEDDGDQPNAMPFYETGASPEEPLSNDNAELFGSEPAVDVVPHETVEPAAASHDDAPAEPHAHEHAHETAADDQPHYHEADEARPVETAHDDLKHDEPRRDDEHHDDDAHDDEGDDDGEHEEEHVEQIGGDALEEFNTRAPRLRRQYKIQEVIKRRQVLLVQVVKEERGNKGAALTTYLSLAGRYSVLMPNTARGGGISRKITDNDDRKRLKAIASELEVPEGMGVILRTAGASRTKQEVNRDFEYLLRMWETVREITLKSSAPTLVYEEGSLIKRAIRDLFNKDVEEVVVSGDAGYKEAHDFMRMLMPTATRNVIHYRDQQPLFARHGVEAQLDSMFSSQVTLKSGGYLVINQTEALVAIDVNSGRSTREHNIEDTAVRTNLEAADEVARQLRLRDLAGLIVVDFIDMEEHRNNRSVERRLKEALKNDRARIQVGRISHFGLLEMSRQRIRTGVMEGSSVICPHCAGAGSVRSTASIALHVLRVLEDTLIKSAVHNLIVSCRSNVALYMLNMKRAHLLEIETRFGVTITVMADDSLSGTTYHMVERGDLAVPPPVPLRPSLVQIDSIPPADLEDEDLLEDEDDVEGPAAEGESQNDVPVEGESEADMQRRRRRRRRRRGRGSDRDSSGVDVNAPQPSDDALAVVAGFSGALTSTRDATFSDGEVDEFEAEGEDGDEALEAGAERTENGEPRRRRRRSRRGGRNRGREDEAGTSDSAAAPAEVAATEHPDDRPVRRPGGSWVLKEAESAPPDIHAGHEISPMPSADAPSYAPQSFATAPVPVAPVPVAATPVATPAPAPVAAPAPVVTPAAMETPAPEPRPVDVLPEAPAPEKKKTGWWGRAKATFGGE